MAHGMAGMRGGGATFLNYGATAPSLFTGLQLLPCLRGYSSFPVCGATLDHLDRSYAATAPEITADIAADITDTTGDTTADFTADVTSDFNT